MSDQWRVIWGLNLCGITLSCLKILGLLPLPWWLVTLPLWPIIFLAGCFLVALVCCVFTKN